MKTIIAVGKIANEPEKRQTKTGKDMIVFKLELPIKGQTFTEKIDVSCFGSLTELGIKANDAVCVSGEPSAKHYQGKDGKTYSNLNIYANKIEIVLSEYHELPEHEDAHEDTNELDKLPEDSIPF